VFAREIEKDEERAMKWEIYINLLERSGMLGTCSPGEDAYYPFRTGLVLGALQVSSSGEE